jgi:TolB-like protein
MAAHFGETPAPLRSARRDVPDHVAAVVMQCLAKDPAERPTDARAVFDRLADATPRRVPRHVPRRRWLAALAVAAVLAVASGGAMFARRSAGVNRPRTIVVVPFENLGDPADAYFAEGVSDEIAGQLARLPGIAVMGRDGVQRFRGSRRAPRDIARELGAAYVLSGTVRWARAPGGAGGGAGAVNAETRVRINPALVDVATGVQAWGEPSEERLTDVFRAQADVAERVARALSVTLGVAARATLRRQDSADPDARDAQLLGRYFLRRRGLDNLRRAEEAFTRAATRDPGYARAWAGLSEAIAIQPAYDTLDASDALLDALLDRAEHAARRAVALDGASPDAQLALARVYATRFQFRDADRAVSRALALDSSATLAHLLAFQIHAALGRMADAGEDARRALALDPRSALALNTRAVWLLDVGRVDSAVVYGERAVAEDSLQPLWRRTLGSTYARAGRFDDAVRQCRRATADDRWCAPLMGLFAGVPAWREPGRAALGALGARPGLLAQPSFAALGYAILGVPDSVFARLAVAIRRRDDSFSYLIGNRTFAPYARDPRWDALVGAVRRR